MWFGNIDKPWSRLATTLKILRETHKWVGTSMLLFDPTWSNHGNHGGLMVASSELDTGKMLVNLGPIRLAGEVYSTIQTLEPLKMLRDWPPKGIWSFTISWTGFVRQELFEVANQNRNIHPNMPSAQTVLSSRRWYLAASCKQTQSQQMKPIPGPKYELLTFNCEHSLRQNTSVWFDLPWLSISTLALMQPLQPSTGKFRYTQGQTNKERKHQHFLDCRVQKKQTLWVSSCRFGNLHNLLVQFPVRVLKQSLFFWRANRRMIPEQWTLWVPAVPKLGTVKNLRHHHQRISVCTGAWSILSNIKPDPRQNKNILWKNMVLQHRHSWNLVMIPFCLQSASSRKGCHHFFFPPVGLWCFVSPPLQQFDKDAESQT